MFFINFLLMLFLIPFFHLYLQDAFVVSILDFIINDVQLLLLSNNTDNNDLLQNINAENNIIIIIHRIKLFQ